MGVITQICHALAIPAKCCRLSPTPPRARTRGQRAKARIYPRRIAGFFLSLLTCVSSFNVVAGAEVPDKEKI